MTTVVAVLVLVTGLSAGSLVAQRPSSDAPPERLVDVGGQRLYVRCAGPTEGGPTVILEAGAGEHSSAWSRVQELLSPQAGSCAYDRAGWGRSEPGPAPRSMTQEAFELRTLLDSAGIAGPYILVGHSYGGLLVRRYVERYGDDVVGLVLVDPTHEDDRLGVVGEGWVRIRERATGHPIPAPRALQRGEEPATGYDPWRDLWPDEFQQLYRARQADPAPLGDRPLIVIAGERERTAPPGTSADLWRDLQAEKIRQMSDLAELSTNGSLVRDPSSGHRVHVDNPELVRSAIHAVIQGIDPDMADSIRGKRRVEYADRWETGGDCRRTTNGDTWRNASGESMTTPMTAAERRTERFRSEGAPASMPCSVAAVLQMRRSMHGSKPTGSTGRRQKATRPPHGSTISAGAGDL
jgi:pimeloyl-ACP methyl ester carboxylesterase